MAAEWVTAIATAGTFVVIAASAIAALLQIRHLRSSNQIAVLNEFRETLESADFQVAERFLALELGPKLSDPVVQAAVLERFLAKEYEPMRMVANFFENMGVFVKTGIIDRNIACAMWNQVVLRNWNTMAPVVTNRRAVFQHDALWENFEYLAVLCKQWDEQYPHGSYPKFARRMTSAELWPTTLERQRRIS